MRSWTPLALPMCRCSDFVCGSQSYVFLLCSPKAGKQSSRLPWNVLVQVVPTTAAMLHMPLHMALATPEPDWGQPRAPDAAQGGGWGSQRVALFSGLRSAPHARGSFCCNTFKSTIACGATQRPSHAKDGHANWVASCSAQCEGGGNCGGGPGGVGSAAAVCGRGRRRGCTTAAGACAC